MSKLPPKNDLRILETVKIPMKIDGRIIIGEFISFDSPLMQEEQHFAIRLGTMDPNEVPLVRIHSECLTGDVFHSMRCDCGDQLEESILKIEEHGGILLYLRQEGRGIGLYNKFSAYRLQDVGLDTYQANQKLGFSDDLRQFSVAAEMLLSLGAQRIKLHTNNMEKVRQLRNSGIEVLNHVPTLVHLNPHNYKYLKAKESHANHDIKIS